MRILLNLPTIHAFDISPEHEYPLGLLSITSYLKARIPDADVKIIIGLLSPVDVESFRPDVIGYSVLSPFFTIVADQIKQFAQMYPRMVFIIGGHHITYIPQNMPKECTVGVLGEGEVSFYGICKLISENIALAPANLSAIRGIQYWNGDELVSTGPIEKCIEVFPHITHYELCEFKTAKKIRYHLMTSRGCPYRCRFCSSSPFWKKIRYNSAEATVDQIEYIVSKFGPSVIHIFDDLMIANKERLKKIHELIIQKGIHKRVSFECWVAGSDFDIEAAQLLKEMNFKAVSIAIESGSPKIYRYLKGNWNSPQQNAVAVGIANRFGFQVRVAVIVGSPDETVDDMEMTYKLLKQLKVAGGAVSVLKPFPGSLLWKEAKSQGIVSDTMADWGSIESNDLSNPKTIFLGKKADRQETLRYFNTITTLLRRKSIVSKWKRRALKIVTAIFHF